MFCVHKPRALAIFVVTCQQFSYGPHVVIAVRLLNTQLRASITESRALTCSQARENPYGVGEPCVK